MENDWSKVHTLTAVVEGDEWENGMKREARSRGRVFDGGQSSPFSLILTCWPG